MGQTTLCYLISYDIRDPKRWRKAFKLLKGYGRPLQYSLFRCVLGQKEFERLRWELEQVLDQEDALLLVGLCSGCVQRVVAKNRREDWREEKRTTLFA